MVLLSNTAEINMPMIPIVFVTHSKIKHVFHQIIEEFNHEEQLAIYFYCLLELPANEIAKVIELSEKHVVSTLTIFSERLTSIINIFKKAFSFSTCDYLPISEAIFMEFEV